MVFKSNTPKPRGIKNRLANRLDTWAKPEPGQTFTSLWDAASRGSVQYTREYPRLVERPDDDLKVA